MKALLCAGVALARCRKPLKHASWKVWVAQSDSGGDAPDSHVASDAHARKTQCKTSQNSALVRLGLKVLKSAGYMSFRRDVFTILLEDLLATRTRPT